MTGEPTDIHGPAATAPQVSHKVARCQVCHTEWQIKSLAEDPSDAKGCPFCAAPARAITIISEAPGYGGAIIG